jgi:hypothetical protein
LHVGYWAWPLFSLRGLAADLQARNAAAANEEVDYARLRRSFTEQIVSAYLRVTGRASKLGALVPFGASIIDPWVWSLGRALASGAPKIFESFLAEFGVTRGVLDRAMAEEDWGK